MTIELLGILLIMALIWMFCEVLDNRLKAIEKTFLDLNHRLSKLEKHLVL